MAVNCYDVETISANSASLLQLVEGSKRVSPRSFHFPSWQPTSTSVVVEAEAAVPLPVNHYSWPNQSTAEIRSMVAQWQSAALATVNSQVTTSLNPPLQQVLELQQWEEAEDLGRHPLHQKDRTRVAYQGVPGAYSELAVHRMFPGCESVPCDRFEAVFEALEGRVSDCAVLPIENSLGGSIHRNYDLLLRHHNLHIIGEVLLPVRHCLLALPGVALPDIRRVISHPQALAQCENTLTTMGLCRDVSREGVDDTAGAAQFIAKTGLRNTAAIASAGAARNYGMNILANDIQDDPNNVTRFVIIGREPVLPHTDGPFKTSIVFSLAEEEGGGMGGLSRVLGGLAFRAINVTKIESRPRRSKPLRIVSHSQSSGTGTGAKEYSYFEYLFYLDFEASMANPKAQSAMRSIEEYTSFLRILGSYPMDILPLDKPQIQQKTQNP